MEMLIKQIGSYIGFSCTWLSTEKSEKLRSKSKKRTLNRVEYTSPFTQQGIRINTLELS